MFLINGERSQYLDAADRGLQYGDGVFETLKVIDGKTQFLFPHLQRLTLGCQKLLIPPPAQDLLCAEAYALATNMKRGVLKLIITRGSGGRGYRHPVPTNPSRIWSQHPLPDYPEHFFDQGVRARFCQHRLAHNPSLAGIKHLNRLEQVLARAEWQDDAIQEGIMLDQDGFVVEGVMTNVFMFKQGCLFTPPLHQCGVTGIIRQTILEIAQALQIPLRICKFRPDALLQAEEVFLTNSVIGIWPVKQLDQKIYSDPIIARQLQLQLNNLCAETC